MAEQAVVDTLPRDDSYKWEKLKPMPTKRVFSTAVDVDGTLYVLGGCDARGTPIDNLESHNAKKNQWNRLANMHTPRAGVAAVSLGNKLLTFGGVDVQQKPTDCLEMYDAGTKSWEAKDTMVEKLLGCSAVKRDNSAVVVGGMGIDTNPKEFLMEYYIENNKWKELSKMPTARYATFSFILGGRLYVLGGRQGKLPRADFEAYDFTSNKWEKLDPIPSKRVFALYGNDGDNMIFSAGGLNQDPRLGMSGAMETYDIRNNKWVVQPEMPTKRGDFAAGYLGNKFVVTGGLGNGGKPLVETEAFDPKTNTWSTLPDMSSAHCSCASTNFQGKLYVIGGLAVGGPSNMVDCLSYKG